VFAITICILVAAAAIGVVALAWSIPQETIDWLRGAVDWMDDNDGDVERTLLTTAGGALALLALVVVLLELLPRSGTDVKVVDLKAGDAVLSTAAISQRVEEAVRRVPHVTGARAAVKAKRKGVLVSLELQVDPDANLASVTDEACQAAQDVLTDKVHVAMAAPPSARLHYRELRLSGRQPLQQRRPREVSSFARAATREPTDPSIGGAQAGEQHEAAVATAEPPAVADVNGQEEPRA
jgi:hypothetical protein